MIRKIPEGWRHKLPLDMRVSLGIVQPNFYGVFEAPDVWETTTKIRARLGPQRIAAAHEESSC
jgi:hypothetical protein